MSRNVFVSFRYKDGIKYKNKLSEMLDSRSDTVDYSEDKDRSYLSEDGIKRYLYGKLKRSSVTIVLLTPLAVNHNRNWRGDYDDWMYDEIRYSLENRENNRTNGLIAVYTPETSDYLIGHRSNGVVVVKDVDNLFRKNMMNVKPEYKMNRIPNVFDRNFDSYCSLISWSEFTKDIGKFIDIAVKKREFSYKYNLYKRL